MIYSGFNPELEKKHTDGTEHVFGAASKPCIALIPEEARDIYLPIGEVQAGKQDTADCATRWIVNVLEAKLTYLYATGKMTPENAAWLKENGYIVDDKIVLSDAFNAILSGTTRVGNSLKAPLDSINNHGFIPKKMLPLEPWMMWDEYMNIGRITQEMRDLGEEFLRRFPINYEKVYSWQFDEVLKTDFIGVALNAWPVPIDGVYPRNDGEFNHAVAMFKHPYANIFDNYIDSVDGDYVKQLAPDYRYWEYGYRVFVSAELTPEDRANSVTVFDTLRKFGLLSFFADFWERFSTRIRGIFHA